MSYAQCIPDSGVHGCSVLCSIFTVLREDLDVVRSVLYIDMDFAYEVSSSSGVVPITLTVFSVVLDFRSPRPVADHLYTVFE